MSNLSERLVLPSGYRCLQFRLQPILGSVSIRIEIACVTAIGIFIVPLLSTLSTLSTYSLAGAELVG